MYASLPEKKEVVKHRKTKYGLVSEQEQQKRRHSPLGTSISFLVYEIWRNAQPITFFSVKFFPLTRPHQYGLMWTIQEVIIIALTCGLYIFSIISLAVHF